MRVPNWIVKTLTVVLFARLSAGMAQTGWEVVKTFQIGGEGGWDYLTIDPQAHRLYVPRSTHRS